VAGLLGELRGLDFTAARRLSLAARASGVPALLLNEAEPLAATLTRWQVAAAPSRSRMGIGVGEARWTVTLARCRGLATGESAQAPQWQVEVKDATGRLGLAALSQYGPLEQAGQRRAG
jgi:protein ImuA